MRRVRVRRVVAVGVGWLGCVFVRGVDVHFGCGQAASTDLAHLQPRTNVECGGRFREGAERNAGVYKGAEQHVAAYAGKTLKICSSHRQ